ncbi:T-cell activation inhibitor, mitochondrial [Nymphon striatum]|nr:T-cell activation inhibitor, mitochondrial [Nymphon striatum]
MTNDQGNERSKPRILRSTVLPPVFGSMKHLVICSGMWLKSGEYSRNLSSTRANSSREMDVYITSIGRIDSGMAFRNFTLRKSSVNLAGSQLCGSPGETLKALLGGQCLYCSYGLRNLSSSEIAAALRPFYFVVHPDLFCQYPHEKKINENSLKSLKAYLEDNRSAGNLFKNSNNTATVTFYLRKTHKNQSFHNGHFQKQTFDLFHNDVPSTVIDILKTCQLSTEYVEKLKSNIHDANRLDESSPNYGFYKPINDFPYHRIQFAQQKILAKHKKSANLTLRFVFASFSSMK